MASNQQVRAGLATSLRNRLGSSTHVYPSPPDTINTPAVIVGGIEWQDHTTDGERVLTVQLFPAVSRRNTAEIDALDELCDPDDGIAAAINADPTLGGVVDSTAVKSVGNYRDLTIGEVDHYAATVTVEVFC